MYDAILRTLNQEKNKRKTEAETWGLMKHDEAAIITKVTSAKPIFTMTVAQNGRLQAVLLLDVVRFVLLVAVAVALSMTPP